MKYYKELKEKLCYELEKIAKKQDLSAGDLEMVHKLTDTIKNIEKILMIEDGCSDDGYSHDGAWRANMEGNYGHGASYARRRDSMGRYSGGGDFMSMLEDMRRNERDPRVRDAMDKLVREMMG